VRRVFGVRSYFSFIKTFFAPLALLCMLAGYGAPADENENVVAHVRHCASSHHIHEALLQFEGSYTEGSFAELFKLVNAPLAQAIEGRYRLGGDAAEGIASLVLIKVWNRTSRYPGDGAWDDARAFGWLVEQAKPFLRDDVASKGRHEINVTPDSTKGETYDPLGNSATSGHSDLRYGLSEISELPDALHRLVLVLAHKGHSPEEIAAEIGRSLSTTYGILREARHSLSEVLKGRPPVAYARARDPELMRKVQQLLENETEMRPALRDGAIKLTEAELMELLRGSTDQTREAARRYYVEGKRPRGIAREMGITEQTVNGAVTRVRTVVGERFRSGEALPTPDEVWIVNGHGEPVTRYRQTDRASEPGNPVFVSGQVFWDAIKDRDLEFQQVAKMRFVEGLSNKYISAVTGVTDQRASDIARHAAKLVAIAAGNEAIAKDNLMVEGDVSMIHTSPVEVPADLYLQNLELEKDPSVEAKLRVAREISGLPVANLARIILVDKNRRRIGEFAFKPENRSDKANVVSLSDLRVAMSHLPEQDAKMLDLHLQHRWSDTSLAHYFKLPPEEVANTLHRGLRQLQHQTRNAKLTLPSVRIEDTHGRAYTTQVDGEEFVRRVREGKIESYEAAREMAQQWKRRQISDEQPMELVDKDGRPLFGPNQQFRAPVPENPIALSLADLNAGLALSRLPDRDLDIFRLRFVHGWGVAGIHYVHGYTLDEINRATLNGIKNLNNVLDKEIGTLNLKVISSGQGDARLNRWGVGIGSFTTEVRTSGNFSQENLRAIAARLAGHPNVSLTQITFVGADGRPALNPGDKLFAPPPATPLTVSRADVDAAVENQDQRLILRLRFEHGWSRALIGKCFDLTDRQVKHHLDAGIFSLQKNLDAKVKTSNLVIR